MQVLKAYRYRLIPTPEQREALEQYAGCCRFVWNYFRAQREAWWQSGVADIAARERDKNVDPNSWVRQCNQLPSLKKHYPWLANCPSQSLQQVLKDLDRAYKDFFTGNKGYPSFRKRYQHDSFRLPDPNHFDLDEPLKAIRLPKIGWIKLRLSRNLQGLTKNATVSRRGKHWYVSIQVEAEQTLPKAAAIPIGIDLGVSDLLAFSDGNCEKGLNFKRLEAVRLRAQRQLSRKRKGSANWKKAKSRLSRIHEQIADKRQDALHKLSSTISKNHALIVIEDLKIKAMSASPKKESGPTPIKGRQKRDLNGRILGQGWGEFARQLEYKSNWRGGQVLKVKPAYTSQTCHRCNHVDPENRKGKEFKCRQCGYAEDADTQAAKNILAAGLAATACGGSAVGLPMKQELDVAVKPHLLKAL